MKLENKNILITGSAVRLGRAIALAFADKGANVAVHYKSSKKEAEELVSQIQKLGLKSFAVKANILKPKEIKAAVEKVYDLFGQIDVLVNNAAAFYKTPPDEVSEDDWDKFLNTNLRSQFYFAREFARLTNGEPAKIINMADSYGVSPSANFIPYGVSKGGVIALTKGLAKAYAPNILVNCICPGLILPHDPSIDQQKVMNATLLKRAGGIDDITKTVVFLAENDYITGQSIFVDGGRCIQ